MSADSIASAPTFDKSFETNVTVNEGDQAELKCKVDNLGENMVNWIVLFLTTFYYSLAFF